MIRISEFLDVLARNSHCQHNLKLVLQTGRFRVELALLCFVDSARWVDFGRRSRVSWRGCIILLSSSVIFGITTEVWVEELHLANELVGSCLCNPLVHEAAMQIHVVTGP